MGFWIFMLAMELLVPVSMILVGHAYVRHAPKEINGASGYRTARSMINRDTWEFANHHFARTWRIVGWILLPLAVAAMLSVFGRDKKAVGDFGLGLIAIQVVVLLASIIPTERALRKTFDENGNRK